MSLADAFAWFPTEAAPSPEWVNGDCQIWTGITDKDGYGLMAHGGNNVRVHRVAYQLHIGPIAKGMLIDHLCHVPACVNPAHLRPVTTKQNGEHRTGAMANSRSGVRGVVWHKRDRRWQASVGHNGRLHYIGQFHDREAAQCAVVEARRKLHTHNITDQLTS